MKYFFSILLLLLFFLSVTRADEVSLKNGSKLIGRVQKIHQDTLHFETDFAGVLQIDIEHVEALVTDAAVRLKRQEQQEEVGQLRMLGDEILLRTESDEYPIELSRVDALWQQGEPSPLESPQRVWTLELGADIAGKTGNTDEFSAAGSFNARRETDDDRLRLYGRMYSSEKNGEETADEKVAGVDYEHQLNTHHSWYTRLELEQDDLEDLDLRVTSASGYGYYFIKGEPRELRGRIGLLYRYESYRNGETVSTPGLDLGLHHSYRFSKWATLTNDFTYAPGFENIAEYRMYHESSLDLALANSKLWTLKLGVANDYNSQTVGDVKHLDTTYFARLVLKLAP